MIRRAAERTDGGRAAGGAAPALQRASTQGRRYRHHRGRDPRAGRGRPRAVDRGGEAQEGAREGPGAEASVARASDQGRATSRRRRPRARNARRSTKSGGSQRSPEQIKALEQIRDRIRGGNPYRLDRSGMLHLPGVAGVQLAGLTEEQAKAQARERSRIEGFPAALTLLPLERQGTEALKPVRLRPFHGVRRATMRRSPTSRCRRSTWLGPATRIEVQLLGATPTANSR